MRWRLILKRRLFWAYPTAIAIFGGFVMYQICRYTLTHSIGLIVFTAIDLTVIVFVWLEYRTLKSKRPSAQL